MDTPVVEILKKYWGHQSFKPLQEDIIQSVISGKDTIALLPTGGGKSICFQVPGLYFEGLCIVVSPLIALMRDQVDNLKKRGIKAVAVNSSLTHREIDTALDNAVYGDPKFLYVSPERLKTDMFIARLPKMKVALLAIDEAHCISQWGHDFRPAYREIAKLREIIPRVPVVALTATATPRVVSDIAGQLAMKNPAIFQKSFTRSNLIYVIQKEHHKLARTLNAIKRIGGSGIVYCSSRLETVRQANLLRANGVAALPYHAGMDSKARRETQDLWVSNKAQVVVATNAFGMGIDKPDVRYVIHLDLPQSMEAYFQEAGRGGRDEKTAYAIMLINDEDVLRLQERVQSQVPEKETLIQVYKALSNYYQLALGSIKLDSVAFDLAAFSKKYNMKPALTLQALKMLEQAGYITLSEAVFTPSYITFLLQSKALYSFEVGHPTFEPLIHFLLRSYEGVFDQPTRINEENIARNLKTTAEKVREQLRHLKELRVMEYQEQTDLPFITFPAHRVKADELIIDREMLKDYHERMLGKMQSMANYAQNSLVCRSRQLVAYFGESSADDCGRCDVCLSRKKRIDRAAFDKIRTAIESELSGEGKSLNELKSIKAFPEEDALIVLRWLTDNAKVKVSDELLLKMAE
jgi:ATP-dependent DNA helicase RecQ